MRLKAAQKFASWAFASFVFSAITRVQAPSAQGQPDKQETITVEDITRSFLVHLPAGYDSHKTYPVVLVLHDRDNDAADMSRISHFDLAADQFHAIVVYPNAVHERWFSGAAENGGNRKSVV